MHNRYADSTADLLDSLTFFTAARCRKSPLCSAQRLPGSQAPGAHLHERLPVPETEMHACACQVKYKDTACTSAFDLCLRMDGRDGGAKCGAVVAADGTVWATLKRGATDAEASFLKLREEPSLESPRAAVASQLLPIPTASSSS